MNDTELKDTCVGMHTPLSERTRPGGRQITGTGPQCFNLRTPPASTLCTSAQGDAVWRPLSSIRAPVTTQTNHSPKLPRALFIRCLATYFRQLH